MWSGLFIKARNRTMIVIADARVVKVVVQDVGNTTTTRMTTNCLSAPLFMVKFWVIIFPNILFVAMMEDTKYMG